MVRGSGGMTDPAPIEKWMTPVDWAEFWATEAQAEDWLLEPIVAAGRQTAIYSTAKSLFGLFEHFIEQIASVRGRQSRSVVLWNPTRLQWRRPGERHTAT
jgi:D-hexose-6-phosphate mutarotase